MKFKLKEHICKHVFKKPIMKKLTSLDYSYENIGVKAKPGCKKKAKPWNARMDFKK